jgi:hypothetical protein
MILVQLHTHSWDGLCLRLNQTTSLYIFLIHIVQVDSHEPAQFCFQCSLSQALYLRCQESINIVDEDLISYDIQIPTKY